MRARIHRKLTWGHIAISGLAFLGILWINPIDDESGNDSLVLLTYAFLAITAALLLILRPRSEPALSAGRDRLRWRIVIALAASVALAFLALLLLAPRNPAPWLIAGGIAIAIIVIVAILALFDSPDVAREQEFVRVPVQSREPPPRTWSVIYATSSGVAIAASAGTIDDGVSDYFVSAKGLRVPLSEVEAYIDANLAPASKRPTDDELFRALMRWGEIQDVSQ